jgi:hypothetical protein
VGADWPGLRFRGDGHGPTLQEAGDKCAIYLQAAAVVANEALLPERIHKFTYPCAGGINHLRQGSLAYLQGDSAFDSLIICPNSNRTRANRLSLKLKN